MSCVGHTRDSIPSFELSSELKKPSCEDDLLLRRVEENEQELRELSGRFDRLNDECIAKLSLFESYHVQCKSPDESKLITSLQMQVQSLERRQQQQVQQKQLNVTTEAGLQNCVRDDKHHDVVFHRIASIETVIEEHACSIQAVAEQLSANSRLEVQTISMLSSLDSTLQQMKDQLMEIHQHSPDVPKVLADEVASAPTQTQKENGVAENVVALEGVQWDVEHIMYEEMKVILSDWSYQLEQSVWDASIFVGHPSIGVLGSLGTVFALLLNISMQAAFIAIVDFIFVSDPDFPSEESAFEWRTAVGHNSVFADPVTRVSLVSRVCGEDDTLSLATRQAEAIAHINDYLESFVGSIESGVLVCFAVNVLWFCHCVSEVMHTYNFATAILHIREGRRTELSMVDEEIHIVTTTWTRRHIALMVAYLRLGAAVASLTAGSLWLSNTFDIQELVLNVAGLSVIMEIDEILYGTFVPTMAKCLLEKTKPLPKRRHWIVGGFSWNSVTFPILMIALSWLVLQKIVLPNRDNMLATREQFCGGTLNFISGLHPAMKLFFTASVPEFESKMVLDEYSSALVMTAGIKELMKTKLGEVNHTSEIRMSYFSRDVQLMDSSLETEPSDWVFFFGCFEDHFGKGDYDLIYADALRAMIEPEPRSCQEVKQYCTRKDWALVRMMCPLTCGCASPFGGLYFVSGCPMENCLMSTPFEEHRLNASCEDLTIAELSTHTSWESYWMRLEQEEMGHGWGEGVLLKAQREGCRILTRHYYRSLCVGSDSVGFLNAFCPVTCECWIRPQYGACPAACSS